MESIQTMTWWQSLEIHQMDVKIIFYGYFLIYTCTQDYVVKGNMVCKLLKSLYGLGLSPYA